MFQSLAVCFLLCALIGFAQTRFEREVLEAEDPNSYAVSKIDNLDAPAIRTEGVEVKCLAYRDAARLYLELEVRNRSGKDVEIGKDFVSVEQAGRRLARTRTSAVAREVETEALKPFVARAREKQAVNEEAKRHIERQETGIAFASLLQTFTQESAGPVLETSENQTIACTFEAPKNEREALQVLIRVGDQEFRFRFRAGPRERTGAAVPSETAP